MPADMNVSGVLDFKPYKPKRGEEYMNDAQIAHFRGILLDWKHKLMEEVDRTLQPHAGRGGELPRPHDRATQESEFTLELRTRDRERKLIRKIRRGHRVRWTAATTATAKRAGSRSASGASKRARLRPCATTARSSKKSAKGRWAEAAPRSIAGPSSR